MKVNFICSFPREVELSSDGFVVENPMTFGITTEDNGPPTVQGNIKDSFKPRALKIFFREYFSDYLTSLDIGDVGTVGTWD